MYSMYEKLKELPLFKGANTDLIHSFAEKTPLSFSKYTPGQKVARAGESCRMVTCLLSGHLTVRRKVWNGLLTLCEVMPEESLIAPDRLFGLDTIYGADYIALDNCGIMEFPKRYLLQLMHESQIVTVNYLNLLSRSSQRSLQAVGSHRHGSELSDLIILLEVATSGRACGISIESIDSMPLLKIFDSDNAQRTLKNLEELCVLKLETPHRMSILSRQGVLDALTEIV